MSPSLAALRIGFIGAGRVAQTLAPAFARAGLNVAAFTTAVPMRRSATRFPRAVGTADGGCAAGRRWLRYGLPDGQ